MGWVRYQALCAPGRAQIPAGALRRVEARVQTALRADLEASRRTRRGARPPRRWLERAVWAGASVATIASVMGVSERVAEGWFRTFGFERAPETISVAELGYELGVSARSLLRVIRRLHLPLWKCLGYYVIHQGDEALLRAFFEDVIPAEQADELTDLPGAAAELGVGVSALRGALVRREVEARLWRCHVPEYQDGRSLLLWRADLLSVRTQLAASGVTPAVRAPLTAWEFSSSELVALTGVHPSLPSSWARSCPARRLRVGLGTTLVFDGPQLLAWLWAQAGAVSPLRRRSALISAASLERALRRRLGVLRACGAAVPERLAALDPVRLLPPSRAA